jgi:mannose-6-phosphate isomerase-like protein (cupin superfamily)
MSTWSAVSRSGETVECPPTGQTIRFLETGTETDGAYARVAITIAAEATRTNSVTHVHPHQTETITVRSGRMGIERNGTERLLDPDESVTFEPGDSHAFWNAGDEALRIETEIRPAMDAELFIRFTYGLSQVGRVTKSGIPLNPLRLGLLLDEFEGHIYLAGLPIALQKLGAVVLAPLARAAGYGIDLDEGYQRA